MRRRWERDRALAHIPFGRRRLASDVISVAADHALGVGVAVRWAQVAHPQCPSLVPVETPLHDARLPRHRAHVQDAGRRVMDGIARCALSTRTADHQNCPPDPVPPDSGLV